jgi:hypothetical protein
MQQSKQPLQKDMGHGHLQQRQPQQLQNQQAMVQGLLQSHQQQQQQPMGQGQLQQQQRQQF